MTLRKIFVCAMLVTGCESSAPPAGNQPAVGDAGAVADSSGVVVIDARAEAGPSEDAGPPRCGPGLLELTYTRGNPAPDVDDRFGGAGGGYERSVALSERHLLVGAAKDDGAGEDAGAAYLFDVGSGKLLQTLVSPMPGAGQAFGVAVALSGELALVGEPGAGVGVARGGAAHLFDLSTGALVRTLGKPGAERNDLLGNAVALEGDVALVAAWGDDAAAEAAGALYLFDARTGDLLRAIVAPGASPGDQLGVSVALSGGRALAGSRSGDAPGVADAGLAFLFDTTTGALMQTFSHPEPASKDQFGYAVALEGTTAVIGSPTDDPEAASTGAAFVFDTKTGALLHTLGAPAKETGDVFGGSVAIGSGRILVGSVRDDNGTGAVGTAYVFDAETFALTQQLQNPTPAEGDIFGAPVALWANRAVVGAGRDDVDIDNGGAVHVYCGALTQ